MTVYRYGTLARWNGKLYDANKSPLPAAGTLARETLNDVMEFDHVIRVWADGSVTDANNDHTRGSDYIHAPSLYDGQLEQRRNDLWELFTHGYTQQYGYRGPIMHSSEFIGGHLARDILAQPGYYVALVDYSLDADIEPSGWAVAFKPVVANYAVVDTHTVSDKGELKTLGYFATENQAASFIETLPDHLSGRYGLDPLDETE